MILKRFKNFASILFVDFRLLRVTQCKVIICKCLICPLRQRTKLVVYGWISTACLRALFSYQSVSAFLLVVRELGLIKISIQYLLYLLKMFFQGSIGLLTLLTMFSVLFLYSQTYLYFPFWCEIKIHIVLPLPPRSQ